MLHSVSIFILNLIDGETEAENEKVDFYGHVVVNGGARLKPGLTLLVSGKAS